MPALLHQRWNSEKTFSALFDNAYYGILLADADTRKFHLGNDMICRMLGYDKKELKETGVLDIHPEEDLPGVLEKFKSAVRNQPALEYVYAHV